MKAECLLENFKKSIGQIEKIAGKNLTLPILGAIYIEATDSHLVIRATNLQIGAEIIIPAKVSEQGVVAVSAQLLGQIASGMTGDFPISLETENDNLIIKTKRSKMTLKSMNAEDFPTLPRVSGADIFEIPTEQFVSGIKSVSYAAAQSDIKPEIASVYLYQDNETLIFVATDAFRLAEKKIKVANIAEFPEILLPVKNILEITRILGEFPGLIKISIVENQISFSNENLYITSRLTGGNYPNYRQIMPKDSKTELIILKADLQNILKSMLVFSDKFNQIDLVIDPKEKICTMTSRNNDTGEGIVNVEGGFSGMTIETRLNQKYISDSLQSISSDSVSFSFTEPSKAMVVRGINDPSFTYLVMPMNR